MLTPRPRLLLVPAGLRRALAPTTLLATVGLSGCAASSSTTGTPTIDADDMFSDVDLDQTPDTSDATAITLVSGEDVTITEAGIYVVSGDVEEATIIVEADESSKVQLVLQDVSIINTDAPAIYVKSADKVLVTTADGDNLMRVTGAFVPDGTTNLDAVIFARDDLVLNGTGSLEIISARGNGIAAKDDLKITGGTYVITAAEDGLEANESIRIAGGTITINSDKDAIHAENDDDDTTGYVYIAEGTLKLTAADDGIRATTLLQIDGGTIDIAASTEGLEATFIQINDGELSVIATDDGINAANKSSAYSVVIEVNGGTIFVEVGSGDTDAFDANGDIIINGGTIAIITPRSAFDADGTAVINGGTVTVNGEVITEIVQEGPGGAGGGGRP